eukprot:TRINITY_DN10190_c0_g3_i2.p1 TRINITY_DN10190_c0_g3~~TRINITY_DN10190_c0_g3_i2.p1  ORF type:complete len:336 (+),score=47.21 TRINITY_DN10190_c0_g3_i2:58-1065(+)
MQNDPSQDQTAKMPEKAIAGRLIATFVLWYASSFVTDTLNKQIQSQVPIPATLTFCQFLTGGVVTALLLRQLNLVPFIPLRKDQMNPIYQIAICWTVGFLTTNMSFGIAKKGSVSFTHAVKATEPVFLVIVAALFFGRAFPSAVWLSLLPIVAGIGIVAVSDLSFTTLSLAMTCVANTCFVLRSLFVKKVYQTKLVDSYNMFYYISWLSAAVTAIIALLLESSVIVEHWHEFTPHMLTLMLFNGLGHFTYNFASMSLLDIIAPLTHSIGNASRRLVLITGSMLFFGQEFLPKHMFGIALLMSGVFAYTYVSKSQAAVDSTNKTAVPASKTRATAD